MSQNTCGSCMCFNWEKTKKGFFEDSHWCNAFNCWRKYDQNACDAFVGKGGPCFLTSACVEQRGLPDDCKELTLLRFFRDEYMMKSTDGVKLVEKYYAIAPDIVERINQRADKKQIYDDIYDDIIKCVELIESKQYEETLKVYTEMVTRVQKI